MFGTKRKEERKKHCLKRKACSLAEKEKIEKELRREKTRGKENNYPDQMEREGARMDEYMHGYER